MSGLEHTGLSAAYRSPRVPLLLVFTLKLFVSEALFSRQPAPPPPPSPPSLCQINIAPEIAGISGIFEGSRWKGGEGLEQGCSL